MIKSLEKFFMLEDKSYNKHVKNNRKEDAKLELYNMRDL